MINLLDSDAFDPEPPHEVFRELRERPRLFRHPEPDGPGFWVVTRHADVAHVLHQPEQFSSAGGLSVPRLPEFVIAVLNQMMVGMDPPEHTLLRRLVASAFTPRMIARLEEGMKLHVQALLDRLNQLDEVDIVTDLALPVPLEVIADIIGVPATERPTLFDRARRSFGEQIESGEIDLAKQGRAIGEILEYALSLVQRKRAHPEDDIASHLVAARVEGNRLADEQIAAFFLLLTNAGIETTTTLLSQSCVVFVQHRDQLRRLVDNPDLTGTAVEELLRWVTPFLHFARTCTEPVKLGGAAIEAGDLVSIWYPAANRDETVFEDPMTFDIGRSPNPHLSFGGGPHFCLGAALARAEARFVLRGIAPLLLNAELSGPVIRSRSNQINGLRSAPLHLRTA
jgi:cholest-4-en-3-one 26-monooxygenase